MFLRISFKLSLSSGRSFEHGEGGAEHADAEVEVAGHFFIFGKCCDLVEEQFQHFLVVEPDSFETMWPGTRRGEVVVNVVMDLDGCNA